MLLGLNIYRHKLSLLFCEFFLSIIDKFRQMARGIKTGGRQKGTTNIITKELRAVLNNFLFKELGQIQERLDLLEPKERIELLIKLMPFVMPKTTSISHTTNEPLDWD